MGSKIDNELLPAPLPAPLLAHCQQPCLQPVYFNVIRTEPPEGVEGPYLMDLKKTLGCVAASIFTLGFSSRVRWLFVRILSRFLIATQEMDFNLSACCSVWGLFNEDPLKWCGFSSSNIGQVGVCRMNVSFIFKMHIYDLLCFLQNGTEGKWFNVLWWVTFGHVWDSRKNISPHLLLRVWAV